MVAVERVQAVVDSVSSDMVTLPEMLDMTWSNEEIEAAIRSRESERWGNEDRVTDRLITLLLSRGIEC
jgi:hypothetical protein